MGAACVLPCRGGRGDSDAAAAKKREASSHRYKPRHSASSPLQPAQDPGGQLLSSNQGTGIVQRTGRVATICHKVGPAQPSAGAGDASQGTGTLDIQRNVGGESSEGSGTKAPLLWDVLFGPNGTYSVPPIDDEDECCPTCLEVYDEENPKITTKCNHHYHLSCILEWHERNDNCPICDKVMVFDENCG